MRDLETAVAEDARGRPDARRILRADCAGLGQGESPDRDLSARRSRFACTAITSEVQPGASRGVVLGYPYRALVDFATGRLAWCRIAGHPGEGAFTRTSTVAIPAKCGG